jgi:hypothetical protein
VEQCEDSDTIDREAFWINELKAIYNKNLSKWRGEKPKKELPPRTLRRYDRPRTLNQIIFGVPWVERPLEFQTPRPTYDDCL